MGKPYRGIGVVVGLGLAAGAGYAIRAAASGIPSTGALTYAGVLESASGPVNGAQPINVLFYDAASGGNILCNSLSVTDAGTTVNVVDGHFSVLLPDSCATAVQGSPNVWVDVLVSGIDTGRTKIGAVPYAVEANHAPNSDNATNATTASAAVNAVDGGSIATTIATLETALATANANIAALQARTQASPWFQVHNSTSAVVAGSTIVWNVVDADPNSGFNTSTGLYTVPVAGTYQVYFDQLMPNAPSGEYRYGILHNGGVVKYTIFYKSSASSWQSIYGSIVLTCAVGDTIGVEFMSGTGNTYGDPNTNVFYGRLVK